MGLLSNNNQLVNPSVQDVLKYIESVKYPANKSDILSIASKNKASPQVMSILESLPNEEFKTLRDVNINL